MVMAGRSIWRAWQTRRNLHSVKSEIWTGTVWRRRVGAGLLTNTVPTKIHRLIVNPMDEEILYCRTQTSRTYLEYNAILFANDLEL